MRRSPESPQPEPSQQSETQSARQEQSVAHVPTGNRLLAALPADEYARLSPYLEGFEVPQKYVFYESEEPISHVHFPVSGVASMLMLDQGDDAVEVGTVGSEGMVGIPVFLGRDSTPGRAVMQVPGAVLQMSVAAFRQEVMDVPGSNLQVLLHHYTHALMVQMSQGVACNRLHTIEQRAARWLLTTRDRVGGPTFPLTQEFLGQMLGVRRASVSEVASALQDASLITYTRGVITILNSSGLEARACACYRIVRNEFDRMLADR